MCRVVRALNAASGGSASGEGGLVRAVIVTLSTVDAYRVSVLKETGLAPCKLTERRARAELDARLCDRSISCAGLPANRAAWRGSSPPQGVELV